VQAARAPGFAIAERPPEPRIAPCASEVRRSHQATPCDPRCPAMSRHGLERAMGLEPTTIEQRRTARSREARSALN